VNGAFVFLGPPASGKGTQAKLLSERLKVPHISLGDILREAVRAGTDEGNRAKSFMDAGKLVPDELTISLAKERFARSDCKNGFIVDGFPRTLKQAEAFESILGECGIELSSVIYITIPVDVAVSRLSGRRSCKKCGAVYHSEFNPPRKLDVCDRCGEKLYQRRDDTEEVIKTRFSVYEKETLPLVRRYGKSGKLKEIDGSASVDEVRNAIEAAGRGK